MKKIWIGLAVAAVVIVTAVQVYKVYSYFTADAAVQEVDIQKDDASFLEVEVTFGAGDLRIAGGAEGWLEGRLDTNVKKWRPAVSYTEKKGTGTAKIHQKMKAFNKLGNNRNNWDLQLSNDIPVVLHVDAGVADADLDLAGIQLQHLAVDAGVGDLTVNLSGHWQDSFDVQIEAGVGDLEIILPKETGVRLHVDKGLGDIKVEGVISQGKGLYVNEAYAGADTVIDVNVDTGIGDVKVSVAK